jgi:UDP-N-acetylglucosamine 2-epimerase
MIKVLLVFGTRPEAIKMAPVVLEMKKYPKQITPIICVTGQHRDMLDQVLTLFQITPDYDLEIMKANQDLFDIFTNTMQGMKNVILVLEIEIYRTGTVLDFLCNIAQTGTVEAFLQKNLLRCVQNSTAHFKFLSLFT